MDRKEIWRRIETAANRLSPQLRQELFGIPVTAADHYEAARQHLLAASKLESEASDAT